MTEEHRKSRARKVLLVVGGTAVALVLLGLFVRALERTLAGHGAELYHGPRGLTFNYVGVLITYLVAAVALAVGFLIRLYQQRFLFPSKRGAKGQQFMDTPNPPVQRDAASGRAADRQR